jgi:predicted ChrR family anti-sigma factor
MSMFLTCEAANARLSDYEDGALSLWQTFLVRLHLLFCPQCRAILATLRALPRLVQVLEEAPPGHGEAALAAALEKMTLGGARPWPRSPVPAEAAALLDTGPDLPLTLLASAHHSVARTRVPEPGPYHLPKGILDQLPPEDQWRWLEGAQGRRRVELLQDAQGRRLILAYAPTGARGKRHRHLGSESILVLAGTMEDSGRTLAPGDWVYHDRGSVHAPEIRETDCWCLIREEGGVETLGWLRA